MDNKDLLNPGQWGVLTRSSVRRFQERDVQAVVGRYMEPYSRQEPRQEPLATGLKVEAKYAFLGRLQLSNLQKDRLPY